MKSIKRDDTAIHGSPVKGSFSRFFKRLPGTVNRFLLPWAACFGLFINTSNCPCCGQPICPTGVAAMGIMSGLISSIIGPFRRRCVFQAPKTSEASSGTPGMPDSLSTPPITVPEMRPKQIDVAARKRGMSRSSFLVHTAQNAIYSNQSST